MTKNTKDFDAIRPGCIVAFDTLPVQKAGDTPFTIILCVSPDLRQFLLPDGQPYTFDRKVWEACGGHIVSWPEEVSAETEQNKPVRSREAQANLILDISEAFALNQEAPTTEFVLRQLEEAEARGAAEQRRKDGEQSRAKLFCQSEKDASDRTPERPDIVQWQKDQNEFFLSSLLEVVTEYAEWRDRKDAERQEPVAWENPETRSLQYAMPMYSAQGGVYFQPGWRPLYTRPANVAALGARIAELEGVEASLRNSLMCVRYAIEKDQHGLIMDTLWMPDGIETVVDHISAALTREGGV